jgi:1,4-alpha-glucan branching enzyme
VRAFWDRWEGDLVHAFGELEARGHLELMTCAATHGFLPLLTGVPQAVRAQVRVGAAHHADHLGRAARGFWMPECGYFPGLDEVLADEGIRFTVLDTHGLLNGSVPPRYGVYAPVYTPSGVAAFGRDPESSRQVWSAETGYPGDFVYRDFYRDIGFDIPLEDLGDVAHPDGIRLFTGIKYHRITHSQGLENKDLYNPSAALEKAAEHAGNFMFNRQHQIGHLSSVMDRPPVIVAPYDAELFGHWWFEGPDFLEMLMRKIHYDQGTVHTATLAEVLRSSPRNQVILPSSSSWGAGGYHEVWLNGFNSWLLRHLARASRDMVDLARRFTNPSPLARRALNQAARELLLAQSSDWPFIMKTRQTVDFAVRHARVHLSRFRRLRHEIDTGRIDSGWLSDLEWRDNIFPSIDYEVYA